MVESYIKNFESQISRQKYGFLESIFFKLSFLNRLVEAPGKATLRSGRAWRSERKHFSLWV